METFWGHSNTFWVGIGAIAACAYTVLVVLTLWFIYRQVRTAAKSFQLEAICRLQALVDDFQPDRRFLFQNCPLELVLSQEQFSTHRSALSEESLSITLMPNQRADLQLISDELRDHARRVIARLNDIGQLVEDGFVDRRVFLGKYHVLVIQCCHVVEIIRRDEENRRGGNYGQRLLRMRRWAINFNDSWPRHRCKAIEITRDLKPTIVAESSLATLTERRVVYRSPSPNAVRYVVWALRRWFSLY